MTAIIETGMRGTRRSSTRLTAKFTLMASTTKRISGADIL